WLCWWRRHAVNMPRSRRGRTSSNWLSFVSEAARGGSSLQRAPFPPALLRLLHRDRSVHSGRRRAVVAVNRAVVGVRPCGAERVTEGAATRHAAAGVRGTRPSHSAPDEGREG